MKRFLLPLLVALALPTTVNAGVDPEVHNLCKDVKDYMGCVKANSKQEGWNPFKEKAFNLKKNDKKEAKLDLKKVEKRCAYGREASMSQGKIGIIENYESCLKYLKEIGATSLDIPFKVHQKCENLLFYNRKVEPYLYCVSNETTWEPPTKYSRDEIVKSYKKYSCEYEDNLSSAPAGFWDGNSCVRRKVPEVATYKGKTYTASRICPEGETMRWQTISGFLSKAKLEELGCMTDKEHEAYWRVAKQRQRERANDALQDSIKDLQKTINPPTINCSSYGTSDGYNTTCTQY